MKPTSEFTYISRCVFGKCHCTHGSMNNIPAEKIGDIELPVVSVNALNSEMGQTCPVVSKDFFGRLAFLPPGTITMTTYNGSISPAGSFYGAGDAFQMWRQTQSANTKLAMRNQPIIHNSQTQCICSTGNILFAVPGYLPSQSSASSPSAVASTNEVT